MREIFNVGSEVRLGFLLPVPRHLCVADGMRYCGVRLHSWGLDRPASGERPSGLQGTAAICAPANAGWWTSAHLSQNGAFLRPHSGAGRTRTRCGRAPFMCIVNAEVCYLLQP